MMVLKYIGTTAMQHDVRNPTMFNTIVIPVEEGRDE